MRRWTRFVLAALALVLFSVVSAGLGQADTPKVKVFPPGSHPYGMTYGQWRAS